MTDHRLCNATPKAEVVQLVRVTFKRGAGVEGDPVRLVYGYFDFGGHLVAEFDVQLSGRHIDAEQFRDDEIAARHTGEA